jgi:hypothetical protein
MLTSLLLALSTQAFASTDRLDWQIEVNGRAVGERSLRMDVEQTEHGELRTLRSSTRIDAKVVGIPFSVRQTLTANADFGPASFISVVEQRGSTSELQGRLTGLGWRLAYTEQGRTRTFDVPAAEVDLSTVDLIDPRSRVPLSRYTDVRVLSAETGEVHTGRVEILGPSQLVISGTPVDVEGYALHIPEGVGRFYYTTEGWLVRFETKVFGQAVTGQLKAPPPRGLDDEPIDLMGPQLRQVEL